MKLNAKILWKDLTRVQETALTADYMERTLTTYTLYTEGISVHADTLYILPDDRCLEAFHQNQSEAAVTAVCLWPSPRQDLKAHWNYLFMDEDVSLNQILLELEDIFTRYNQWEHDLTLSLSRIGTISDLCHISLPIFGNPIMVHNRDYEIVGSAEANGMRFDYPLKEPGTDYLNETVTKDLFFRSDYPTAAKYTAPQYWLDDEDDMLSIYVNIFDEQQEYWGRIIIDGVNDQLMDGHLALLSVLEEAVRPLALKKTSYRAGSRKIFKRFAMEYFRAPQTFRREQLLTVMHLNGWHRKDHFFCVCAETSAHRLQLNTVEYESMVFDRHFHNYLSLTWNERLILICNLTLSGQSREKECRQLAYIIRENLYKSGISTEFQDFFDFPDYFLQAQSALYAGQTKNGTKWLFKFEDYALAHILRHGANTLPLKTLVPGYILALHQYDKKHDTAYLQTLQSYIESDAHTVKAIDKLYIHRSTFNSRMKKIREMTAVDLDSYENRMYLMIIFRILQKHPELLEE